MIQAKPDTRGRTMKGIDLKEHAMKNIRLKDMGFKPAKIYINRDKNYNM